MDVAESEHTDLILVIAGLLNTRGDAANELGLLTVALEVEQLGATITLQGREEAAQLEVSVSEHVIVMWASVVLILSRRVHWAAGRWRGQRPRKQSKWR